MFSIITNEQPAVLCLQEFYSQDKGTFRNLDTLPKLLSLLHVHSAYTTTLRKTDHWGVATFSKYPIVNEGKIVFNRNGAPRLKKFVEELSEMSVGDVWTDIEPINGIGIGGCRLIGNIQ